MAWSDPNYGLPSTVRCGFCPLKAVMLVFNSSSGRLIELMLAVSLDRRSGQKSWPSYNEQSALGIVGLREATQVIQVGNC